MSSQSGLSPLKQAYLALEDMQAKLEALERAKTEPIAIIGLGCRLPGANDPEAYWQLLRAGRDAIREVPKDRWNALAVFDPEPGVPGKAYTRWAGFLDQVDRFDPQFFGIAPREAVVVDPQHRLVLEVVWEALENAAQAPDKLEGSRTGVFLGIASLDYSNLFIKQNDPTRLDAYYGTGVAHSAASGRVSYLLGLQGPSISLDTACSSSLVAVHLAVQSLRTGECRMALAGGVHLSMSPDNTISFSQAHMLALDGHSRTFDARADGFGDGEGCGIVVLKRLSDALADGDRILALICGTAANQDGASSSLTAPNGPSQEAVIREALANGHVQPHEVDYVEAHGTGTTLGDPIEVRALGAVLSESREPDRPLLIGAVKANIGHLEAAAGIAGLIKVVLMLQHKEIPPLAHFETPNPYIEWDRYPIAVPTECLPWQSERRIAGVSAFGFSGTNAHAVLTEAPVAATRSSDVERPIHLLTLSAKNNMALKALAERLEQHLADRPTESLADVCFTANTGRAHFNHRLALQADSASELRERLAAYRAGHSLKGILSGEVPAADQPKIAFLFTGHGSHYIGMGQQLYETQPVFKAALDRCDEILRPYLSKSLLPVLYPENRTTNPEIDQAAFIQPVLFALQYALTELWKSWGITPSAVLGHSAGEYAAACAASVFSLEDGLKLIAERGRLMQALPRGGEMAAVFADEAGVAEAIKAATTRVSIAAINGPDNVVISGEAAVVRSVLDQLRARGIRSRLLNIPLAAHSPLMTPMLDAFEHIAAQVAYAAPKMRLISNVTGKVVGSSEVTQAAYWRRHLLQPVRFAASIATLHDLGYRIFVEIGPSTTLLGMGRRCLTDDDGTWLPSLRPDQADWQQILDSLAQLYVCGVRVDWAGFDRPYARCKLALPTYPFQRERCWLETKPSSTQRAQLGSSRDVHPLLGRRVRSALKQIQFEAELQPMTLSFLNDHRLNGMAVLPGTAYLEAAWAAGRIALQSDSLAVEDVVIHDALIVPDDAIRLMQLIVTPDDNESATWQVFSAAEDQDEWMLHANGRVCVVEANQSSASLSVADVQLRCVELVSADVHYQTLRDGGLDFGPSLCGVQRLWRRPGEALGEIQLPSVALSETKLYSTHPALLDACVQVLTEALPDAHELYLPFSFERFRRYRPVPDHVWSHVNVRSSNGSSAATVTGDIRVFSRGGELIAEITGLSLKRLDSPSLSRLTGHQPHADWLYEIEWELKNRSDHALIQRVASFLPALNQIVQHLQAEAQSLGHEPGLNDHAHLLPQLEALSIDFVWQALQGLGCPLIIGQRFTSAALMKQAGVVPQHRRLFTRLLDMLAEAGLVKQTDDDWVVIQVPPIVDARSTLAALAKRYPAGKAELDVFDRCAPQLAAALRGDVDPLQLLFPGGSLSSLEALYQSSPLAQAYNSLVRDGLAQIVAELPKGRTLRVLEIGAGTGGTTAHVLPILPSERCEYTFTDVSPVFLSQAQDKFRSYSFMHYQLLDVERDPGEQGFASHAFDVIIAANVIHATTDLRQSLQHVQQLLTPEGLLIMLEVSQPQRWIDLTFGLTEGWWKFSDHEWRAHYPLLSRDRWLKLLSLVGFADVAAIAGGKECVTALADQTMLLARPTQSESAAGSWIILADAQGTGQQLAEALRERGEPCVIAKAGATYSRAADHWQLDPAHPDHFEQLLRDVFDQYQSCRGVVHLWSLDAIDSSAVAHLQSGLHLTQALIKTPWPNRLPGLWLITRNAQAVADESQPLAFAQSPLWGFARTLALEHPELRCTRIDLDTPPSPGEIDRLVNDLLSPDNDDQLAYRGNDRFVAHLVRHSSEPMQREPQQLQITTRGAFDQLAWRPITRRSPGAHEVEIEVVATGLNFRDVMNVLGMYPGDPGAPGGECAGVITAIGTDVANLSIGDEVIALATGSFSAFVIAPADLVVRTPVRVTFEQAATIAIPFVTAYYSLHHLGQMQAGDRVLIHAAAGGVGLAAVQLAQRVGAEVFATAGSDEKRAYLRSLGVPHVMDSRSLAFADEIRSITNGQGVDMVLNSLAGGFARQSLSVMAANGRFLEIGKRDLLTQAEVEQANRNIAYHIIDWGETAKSDPALIRSMLLDIMALIDRGELKPLPLRAFPATKAIDAFRFMAQAKHIGKIVITQPVNRFNVRADATYWVTGGLSGLGLLTAQWLVDQGARYLVLMGRRAPTEVACNAIGVMEQSGAQVTVMQSDVSCYEDVVRVVDHIDRTLPPLRGIIHAAGVLDDAALLQQDWSHFVTVFAPKVNGTWYLQQLTEHQPLDFFVMYSSVAAVFGSAGQANHAAANAFMDALVHHRRWQGLAGLSINWGVWSQIGAAAARGVEQRAIEQGVGSFTPTEGLAVLEDLLKENVAQVVVTRLDWPKFMQQFTAIPPFLSKMTTVTCEGQSVAVQPAPAVDWLRRITDASAAKQRGILIAYVQEQAGRVLGIDPAKVSERVPLNELGLDSLMAVELRNRLGTELQLQHKLPATLVFDYPTVEAMADYLAKDVLKLTQIDRAGEPPSVGSVTGTGALQMIDSIEDLSDEEVDRLLTEKRKSMR